MEWMQVQHSWNDYFTVISINKDFKHSLGAAKKNDASQCCRFLVVLSTVLHETAMRCWIGVLHVGAGRSTVVA